MRWNGKILQSGGGGYGGSLVTAPGRKGSGYFDPQPLDDTYPLTQGYVTFGSDTGHPQGSVDFLLNDESLRNFGGEELKKTRDVAYELTSRFYGRRPAAVYFSGESDGGRQAFIVAQRYPKDYDVVLATSPVLSWNYLMLASNRVRTSLIDGGWLDQKAVKLIADRTRAACDQLDGVADTVLGKYQDCTMDPDTLRCPDGTAGDGCLSDAQLRALENLREPWRLPFQFANGVDGWPGTGVTGDEDRPQDQYFAYPVGTVPPSHPLPPGSAAQADPGRGALLTFGANWVRWAVAQDGTFDPYRFYAPVYKKRIQYLSSVVDATNPDLSAFARNGGKLILLQPSADNAVSTRMVAEYYNSVVAKLGRQSVSHFFRFYVGPGGSHNVGGISKVDLLGAGDRWFSRGVTPPDSFKAVEQDPATLAVQRSMPACQWPSYPRYTGGDKNVASSFRCTQREDPLT